MAGRDRISLIKADVAIPITESLARNVLESRGEERSEMATLERTCTVDIAVEDAERRWHDYIAQQQLAGGQPGAGAAASSPGTVFFHESGRGKTQVTMQLDAEGDQNALNERVDEYLQRFRRFVESR